MKTRIIYTEKKTEKINFEDMTQERFVDAGYIGFSTDFGIYIPDAEYCCWVCLGHKFADVYTTSFMNDIPIQEVYLNTFETFEYALTDEDDFNIDVHIRRVK